MLGLSTQAKMGVQRGTVSRPATSSWVCVQEDSGEKSERDVGSVVEGLDSRQRNLETSSEKLAKNKVTGHVLDSSRVSGMCTW